MYTESTMNKPVPGVGGLGNRCREVRGLARLDVAEHEPALGEPAVGGVTEPCHNRRGRLVQGRHCIFPFRLANSSSRNFGQNLSWA